MVEVDPAIPLIGEDGPVPLLEVFEGRRQLIAYFHMWHAGQPAAYRPMAAQLREQGLPLRTARISALRQLVLQVPAPVIAGALGFHHTTTTRQHVKAGGPWSQYAGGDREP